MKYSKIVLVGLLSCACSVACDSRETEQNSSPKPRRASRQDALMPVLTGLTTVSAFRAGRLTNVDVGDSPAQAAFSSLQTLFDNGGYKTLEFGIYELEPVSVDERSVLQRAAELGLSGAVTSSITNDFWQAATDGDWHLRVMRNSGAELLFDATGFHIGDGVNAVRPRGDYVTLAQDYVANRFANIKQPITMYPYKIYYYKNAEVEQVDDFSQKRVAAPTESTYQVSVAMNTCIDDLPVIGSGGKIAVHMNTTGAPVGHEAQVRLVSNLTGIVNGEDLTAPNNARVAVEARLKLEDIDVTQYVLKRAEFGYWRAGRNNVQSVLAPHYAFIYEPAPNVEYGKKLVETIPAVASGPFRSAIDSDAQIDIDRRKVLVDGLRESDPR